MAVLACLALLGGTVVIASSVVEPFSARFTITQRGSIELIGNTLLTCPSSSTCADALDGNGGDSNDNNDFSMVYVDIDSDGATFDSSNADLDLPTGAEISFAGLYWGAESADSNRDRVQLKLPGDAYQTVVADDLVVTGNNYAAFADITADIAALGNPEGTYTVANVQAVIGTNKAAGWSLVVAYRDVVTPAPLRNLTVFDGFLQINTSAPSELTTVVSGFITPTTGAVTAAVGMVTFEGDLGLTGDQFLLNGTAVSNATNPATNLFNSSISRLGATVTNKNPNYLNQLGFDVDLIDGTGYIGNSDTSATLTFNTSGDVYYPTVMTFAVDVLEPEIIATKSVDDVNGGTLGAGDQIEYTIDLVNNGTDPATDVVLTDPIPSGTTYLPNSLSIVSGPGAATLTDQAADDRAEYDAGDDQVVFRLGVGGDASNGGTLDPGGTTTVRFSVSVDDGLTPAQEIENQARVDYSGETVGGSYSADSDGEAGTPGDQPTVIVANSPPVANDDSATTDEDTPVEISVLDNDDDPDGADDLDPASVSVISGPTHGDATVNPTTGVITYTPDADYFGPDQFAYSVCDSAGACDTATVDLTVTAVSDPPDAVDDVAATGANEPVVIDVLAYDTDPDGANDIDPSCVSVTDGPAHGNVTVDAGSGAVTYTPDAGYIGGDSFTYDMCDFDGEHDSAVVTISVGDGEVPPTANDDAAVTDMDTPVTIDVLANDDDANGAADLNATSVTITADPAHGDVAVDPISGHATYTPSSGYVGNDAFSYQVCDFALLCDSADVTVSVAAVNAPPSAADDSASTGPGVPVTIEVLANDHAPAGWDLSCLTVTDGPAQGSVQIDWATGEITYVPDASYVGSDEFTYDVCDLLGVHVSALVTINVLLPDTAIVSPSDLGQAKKPGMAAIAIVFTAGLLLLLVLLTSSTWRARLRSIHTGRRRAG